PAATSRGFGTAEFREVGRMIAEVIDGLSCSNDGANEAAERAVASRVRTLCARFPIYPGR
ncbi:MAG: serine hydroxymethyltransferase, partial [Acetobacteraceae bacterium]